MSYAALLLSLFFALPICSQVIKNQSDSFIGSFFPFDWDADFDSTANHFAQLGYTGSTKRSALTMDKYYGMELPSGLQNYDRVAMQIFGFGNLNAAVSLVFWERKLIGFRIVPLSPTGKDIRKFFTRKYGPPSETISLPNNKSMSTWRYKAYKADVVNTSNKIEEISCFVDLQENQQYHEQYRLIQQRIDYIKKSNPAFFNVDKWFEFDSSDAYLVFASSDTLISIEKPVFYHRPATFFFIVRAAIKTDSATSINAYHFNMGKGPDDRLNHNVREIVLQRSDFQAVEQDSWIHDVFRPVPELKYCRKNNESYRNWLYDYPPGHYLRKISDVVLELSKTPGEQVD